MHCYNFKDCAQKDSEIPGSNYPFCRTGDFTSFCSCCQHHNVFKDGNMPSNCELCSEVLGELLGTAGGMR